MQNILCTKMNSHAARIERFMDRIIPEPNSGCWLWLGELRKDGYGECWVFGKRETAHRAAYRELVCDIPDGAVIRHRCDTRSCANPDHLLSGTQADNMADKVERDRQAKGTGHGRAKLTEQDVLEIRSSDLPKRALARKFNVDPGLIRKILRRDLWAHLD